MEPCPQLGHFLRHPLFKAAFKLRSSVSGIVQSPFQSAMDMRVASPKRNPEKPQNAKKPKKLRREITWLAFQRYSKRCKYRAKPWRRK